MNLVQMGLVLQLECHLMDEHEDDSSVSEASPREHSKSIGMGQEVIPKSPINSRS